jgi:hypothetical protein
VRYQAKFFAFLNFFIARGTALGLAIIVEVTVSCNIGTPVNWEDT